MSSLSGPAVTMNPIAHAFVHMWQRGFNFNGRTVRKDFWWYTICALLITPVLYGGALLIVLRVTHTRTLTMANFVGVAGMWAHSLLLGFVCATAATVVVMWPLLPGGVRRLRDTGRGWGIIFIGLLPWFAPVSAWLLPALLGLGFGPTSGTDGAVWWGVAVPTFIVVGLVSTLIAGVTLLLFLLLPTPRVAVTATVETEATPLLSVERATGPFVTLSPVPANPQITAQVVPVGDTTTQPALAPVEEPPVDYTVTMTTPIAANPDNAHAGEPESTWRLDNNWLAFLRKTDVEEQAVLDDALNKS